MCVRSKENANLWSRMANVHLTQDNPWQRPAKQLIMVVSPKQWVRECSLWQAADRSTSPTWSEDVLQRLSEGLF